MKKLSIMAILSCIAGIAYGVTVITYNVPDVFGAELLAALTAQSDSNVVIQVTKVDKSGGEPRVTYFADISFEVPAKDPALSNADFVKKRIARFAVALEKAHEKKIKQDAKKAYLSGAPSVNVDAPDPDEMN